MVRVVFALMLFIGGECTNDSPEFDENLTFSVVRRRYTITFLLGLYIWQQYQLAFSEINTKLFRKHNSDTA